MKLREKLIYRYLPMWAKETVLYENRTLKRRNEELEHVNRELQAYIDGIKLGFKYVRELPQEGNDG